MEATSGKEAVYKIQFPEDISRRETSSIGSQESYYSCTSLPEQFLRYDDVRNRNSPSGGAEETLDSEVTFA